MNIQNALTIDVEDYYMVTGFADRVRFEDWPKFESRVAMSTRKVLALLSRYGVKATFFVLGWVAENDPRLVREIHSEGHEVACHGYNHRLIYDTTPDEFREDIRKSKRILEDISGRPVAGYRAASYSVTKKTLWALDILMEEGFLYDSSIFPIHHDRYGIPDACRFPYEIKRNGGALMEFPPSTLRLLGQNLPVAGGGYLRLLPSWLTRAAAKKINSKERKPVIFYIHPWEVDEGQPRLKVGSLSAFRHYTNIKSTSAKLEGLMREFSFRPLSAFLDGNA
ncbi:MAG: DUF3473 domain-containing protein [Thermodesulfobacteriota bacterium]|nr:MAG: DUF3473 domain-containing protein [Thermodesulfobacteriota bacterium]